MEKFVPIDKRSKKNKKEVFDTQRHGWEIHPRTRTIPDKKRYDRHKKDYEEDEDYEI